MVDRLDLAIFLYAPLFLFEMYPEYGLVLLCDISKIMFLLPSLVLCFSCCFFFPLFLLSTSRELGIMNIKQQEVLSVCGTWVFTG